MRKARVFISCGQATDREKNIGLEVERHFRSRGFETYFAEKVHSPEGLTEHIFKFLKESEYFVFIDFRRSKLSETESRGSLFVGQEIGIATFLKIPGLGFLEKGIRREGILNYQIHNAFYFEDGIEIINKLREETIGWQTESVNELLLTHNRENDSLGVVLNNDPNLISDWWHIQVVNRNLHKHALTCSGYVTKIRNLESDNSWEIPTIELIWSGIGVETVNILAGSKRELDGFFLIRGSGEVRFNVRAMTTNNLRFNLPVLTPGNYLIEYSVISSNFEIASSQFVLNFPANSDSIEFAKRP